MKNISHINESSISTKNNLRSILDWRLKDSLSRTKLYIDGSIPSESLEPTLSHIHVETCSTCNYACPSCPQGNVVEARKLIAAGVMSDSIYSKIIKESSSIGCTSVALFSTNEPLLDRSIFERINFAYHYMPEIILVTNGSLLTNSKSSSLLQTPVSMVSFSLDAFSQATYEKVRPRRANNNSSIEDVYRNINFFLEQQTIQRPDLRTRVSFVVQKNNQHELDQFLSYWQPKVDIVSFQPPIVFDFNKSEVINSNYTLLDWNCNLPFHMMQFRADGSIMPCCHFYGYNKIFGNIANISVEQAWSSNYMIDLRSRLRCNENDDVCSKCLNSTYSPFVN